MDAPHPSEIDPLGRGDHCHLGGLGTLVLQAIRSQQLPNNVEYIDFMTGLVLCRGNLVNKF